MRRRRKRSGARRQGRPVKCGVGEGEGVIDCTCIPRLPEGMDPPPYPEQRRRRFRVFVEINIRAGGRDDDPVASR